MSVTKDEFIEINGISQFLHHRISDYKNPVLLFIHGGPGVVESNYAYLMESWDKDFTVVHFDQRGSGKTLIKNPNSYPTIDEIIEDIKKIIQYLKNLYEKKKIFLLGYSFGSVIGSIYAKKYPEDIEIYIGVGQLVNMQANEKVLYRKLKNEFEKLGKKRRLKQLKSLGDYPEKKYTKSMQKKYETIEELVRVSSIKTDNSIALMSAFIHSPIFKFSDLIAMIKSKKANRKLMEFLIDFDLRNYGLEYKVPICYILGENDWQAATILARKFFLDIKADKKYLFVVEHAKHRPFIENKVKFDKILVKLKNELNIEL